MSFISQALLALTPLGAGATFAGAGAGLVGAGATGLVLGAPLGVLGFLGLKATGLDVPAKKFTEETFPFSIFANIGKSINDALLSSEALTKGFSEFTGGIRETVVSGGDIIPSVTDFIPKPTEIIQKATENIGISDLTKRIAESFSGLAQAPITIIQTGGQAIPQLPSFPDIDLSGLTGGVPSFIPVPSGKTDSGISGSLPLLLGAGLIAGAVLIGK